MSRTFFDLLQLCIIINLRMRGKNYEQVFGSYSIFDYFKRFYDVCVVLASKIP